MDYFEDKALPDNIDQNVKLSPPWVAYYHKVFTLFERDPDVTIHFSEKEPELRLLVTGAAKAEALSKLMPESVAFGNVILKIIVVPANEEPSVSELLKIAFAGNNILQYVATSDTPFGVKNYAVFDRGIAQFYNDEMGDIHGVKSMLYEDVARDVFTDLKDVCFNTFSDDLYEG